MVRQVPIDADPAPSAKHVAFMGAAQILQAFRTRAQQIAHESIQYIYNSYGTIFHKCVPYEISLYTWYRYLVYQVQYSTTYILVLLGMQTTKFCSPVPAGVPPRSSAPHSSMPIHQRPSDHTNVATLLSFVCPITRDQMSEPVSCQLCRQTVILTSGRRSLIG